MINLARRSTVSRYGRKFRDKSGRLVRYVYKHGRRIGVEIFHELRRPATMAEKKAVKAFVRWDIYNELTKR